MGGATHVLGLTIDTQKVHGQLLCDVYPCKSGGIPYNGFISRGANFPELNLDSGKLWLGSFYYYSLASPCRPSSRSAYRLNIISAAISSLIIAKSTVVLLESTIVLHQQPAIGWVLYNMSRSSGRGIMISMGDGTIDFRGGSRGGSLGSRDPPFRNILGKPKE